MNASTPDRVAVATIAQRARRVEPAARMACKIIAVDGPGGAGKSTLARLVAEELRAPVVQIDDFSTGDPEFEWWPRLLDQVLRPIASGRCGRYQRYDWDRQQLAEWHAVAPGEYLILEGVSAGRIAFRPFLALTVWVRTPRDVRLRRGLERDGQAARDQWLEWMAEEDDYVARERPEEFADLIVNGY